MGAWTSSEADAHERVTPVAPSVDTADSPLRSMSRADVLIVGAGLTAASIVARLRQLRADVATLVVDVRSHLAGNCFDELRAGNTRVHRYGPHLFHSPSPRLVKFLSAFTEWDKIEHAVTAEVEVDGRLCRVPFPYSRLTAERLGRPLSADKVAAVFFRGYSQKMWGRPWEELPAAVRERVPTNDTIVPDRPSYFPGQFVAMPRGGYTPMIEQMFGSCSMQFGCDPLGWREVKARHVVYTGRPDLLPLPGSTVTLGEAYNLTLPYRTLDLCFESDLAWSAPTAVINFCHESVPYTRRTCYRLLTGGTSDICSTETPRDARVGELAPFYPVISEENRRRYARLKEIVAEHYPGLILAGRLGTYQYLDMYQAVGQGIAVAEKLAAAW